jgi:hypothetical protein
VPWGPHSQNRGRQALPDQWWNLSGDFFKHKCLHEWGYVFAKNFVEAEDTELVTGTHRVVVDDHRLVM